MFYKLNEDKQAVPCSATEYSKFMSDFSRARVALTQIGAIEVSTVFLGINHAFNAELELFETMVFGGEEGEEEYQERCSTWEQAEAMHQRAVDKFK